MTLLSPGVLWFSGPSVKVEHAGLSFCNVMWTAEDLRFSKLLPEVDATSGLTSERLEKCDPLVVLLLRRGRPLGVSGSGNVLEVS